VRENSGFQVRRGLNKDHSGFYTSEARLIPCLSSSSALRMYLTRSGTAISTDPLGDAPTFADWFA